MATYPDRLAIKIATDRDTYLDSYLSTPLCEATATSIAADCRERWGAAPPIEVHANDRSQVRVRARARARARVRARVT